MSQSQSRWAWAFASLAVLCLLAWIALDRISRSAEITVQNSMREHAHNFLAAESANDIAAASPSTARRLSESATASVGESAPPASSPLWTPRRPPTCLRVRVFGQGDAVIAGALVVVSPECSPDFYYQGKRLAEKTDAAGLVMFEDWPSGIPFRIVVTAEAHVYRERVIHPPPDRKDFDIEVRPEFGLGGVRGRLVSRSSGAGVSGALDVEPNRPMDPVRDARTGYARSTVTDAEGRFQFAGLTPGTWKLFAGSHATSVATIPVTVTESTIVELGDVLLEDPVYLEGVLLDEDGNPMPGIQLSSSAFPAHRMTTQYNTKGVPWVRKTEKDGSFRLQAKYAGATTRILGCDYRSPAHHGFDRIFGPFTAPARDLRLVWKRYGDLVVCARLKESGRPATQALGSLVTNDPKTDRSYGAGNVDADPVTGELRFVGAPPGSYSMQIMTHDGSGAGVVTEITIPEGESTHRVAVELPEPKGTIRARFIDTRNSPISFLPVSADWARLPSGIPRRIGRETDFAGAVKFYGFVGSIRLEVNDPEFEPWSREIEAPNGDFDVGTVVLSRLPEYCVTK